MEPEPPEACASTQTSKMSAVAIASSACLVPHPDQPPTSQDTPPGKSIEPGPSTQSSEMIGAASRSSASPGPDQLSTSQDTSAGEGEESLESGLSTQSSEMSGAASRSSASPGPDQLSTSQDTSAGEGEESLESGLSTQSSEMSGAPSRSSASPGPQPDQPSTSQGITGGHIGPYTARAGLTVEQLITGTPLPRNCMLTCGLVFELTKYLQGTIKYSISQVANVLLKLKQVNVTSDKQVVAYIRALQQKINKINRNKKGDVRESILREECEKEFLLVRTKTVQEETPRKKRLREALDAEKSQHKAVAKKLKMTERKVEHLAAQEELSSIELQSMKDELETQEAASKKMAEDIKTKDDDVQIMQHAMEEISAELALLQNRHDELLLTLSNLQEKFNPMEDELNSYKLKCQEATEDIEKLEKDMSTARSKLATFNTRNVNKRLKRRDLEIQKLKDEQKQSDSVITELREELELTKAQLQGTKSAFDHLTSARRANKSLKRKLNYQKAKKYENILDSSEDDHEYDKRITALKQRVKELNGCLALCEDEAVVTFHEGRYTNAIRELIMELLSMNVSMSKVSDVIKATISKLTNLDVGRLPSKATISRLIMEAKILADIEVGLAMSKAQPEDALGNVIHGDGTTKFHKKYQNYQVTLPDGSTRTMGVMEMGRGDTEAIVESFKDKMHELSEELSAATQESDSTSVYKKLIATVSATMTDQGATMPQFHDKLKAIREEILPATVNNWDNLPQDVKETMLEFGKFFCKMHPIINFADEVNKTLKTFEDLATSGKNQHTIISSEAGVTRLVRTASKAFHHRGCDKSGVEDAFSVYLEKRYNAHNHIVHYIGNRANILFEGAATTYYHRTHIRNFVNGLPDANQLLKAVFEDVSEPIILAELKALGLVHKLITEPLWHEVKTADNILSLNDTLHKLQTKLDIWKDNPQGLMDGEPAFQGAVVDQDDIFDVLITKAENDDVDDMCTQALHLICCAILLILERQCQDNLPGGKYWNPSRKLQERFKNVPTTNMIGERDFGYLDLLVRQKPSARITSLEAIIMWTNNQTVRWLDNLDKLSRDKYMDIARSLAPEMLNQYQQRKKKIQEQRWESVQAKQKAKIDKEQKLVADKVKLTEGITDQGGLWTTVDRVEREFATLCENMSDEKVRREIHRQLLFHQKVLKTAVANKEYFQLSQTVNGKRQNYTKEEMKEHLNSVIIHNRLHEEEPQEIPQAGVQYETEDVRSKRFEEKKKEIFKKLENERKKRGVQESKHHLQTLITNPHLLLNKSVEQKCVNPSGYPQWYKGSITSMARPDGLKTVFTIQYDAAALEPDEELCLDFPLLKDLKNNDLIIIDKLNTP